MVSLTELNSPSSALWNNFSTKQFGSQSSIQYTLVGYINRKAIPLMLGGGSSDGTFSQDFPKWASPAAVGGCSVAVAMSMREETKVELFRGAP